MVQLLISTLNGSSRGPGFGRWVPIARWTVLRRFMVLMLMQHSLPWAVMLACLTCLRSLVPSSAVGRKIIKNKGASMLVCISAENTHRWVRNEGFGICSWGSAVLFALLMCIYAQRSIETNSLCQLWPFDIVIPACSFSFAQLLFSLFV